MLFPGYVQGMSDLLSPLLFVTQNEVESFWCLTGFMELVVSGSIDHCFSLVPLLAFIRGDSELYKPKQNQLKLGVLSELIPVC